MRPFVSLGILYAGCSGGGSGDVAGTPDADDDTPIPSSDAGDIADAAPMPDGPPMEATIFESATLKPGPFVPLHAQSTNAEQLLGVRFTTTTAVTVTGLGAHVYTVCLSCTTEKRQFMAIVPIDPATNLPSTTNLPDDAIGYGVAKIPNVASTATMETAPPSTVFPASFDLPAGTWGLVIGGGYYDTLPHDIHLSTDVVPVGDPQYFHYTFENAQWWYGQHAGPDKRMFVIGF